MERCGAGKEQEGKRTGNGRTRNAGAIVVERGSVGATMGRLQKRVSRNEAGWTEEKRAIFLAVLRETVNVTAAAEAAGRSREGVYLLRKRDPGFAREWERAIADGYGELEMEMMRRAVHGQTRTETLKEGAEKALKSVRTIHDYDNGMAMKILALHADTVARMRAADAARAVASDDPALIERVRVEIARAGNGAGDGGGHEGGGDGCADR